MNFFNKEYHVDTSCKIETSFEMHPIAYRVHTHELGTVLSGYVAKNGKMFELGRMDPQKPQVIFIRIIFFSYFLFYIQNI